MAADDVAGLLHPQLAIMAQAVQPAQLAQQVAHPGVGRAGLVPVDDIVRTTLTGVARALEEEAA